MDQREKDAILATLEMATALVKSAPIKDPQDALLLPPAHLIPGSPSSPVKLDIAEGMQDLPFSVEKYNQVIDGIDDAINNSTRAARSVDAASMVLVNLRQLLPGLLTLL